MHNQSFIKKEVNAMNVFTGTVATDMEAGARMVHGSMGPGGPAGHIPPHERKAMVRVEYDAEDMALLADVFGDEDTAATAAEVILGAPPEIQILAVQIINIIKKEAAE